MTYRSLTATNIRYNEDADGETQIHDSSVTFQVLVIAIELRSSKLVLERSQVHTHGQEFRIIIYYLSLLNCG